MRLFPGFLLFFKDACQRRSCRISHQSPPPMPPPPALCLSFTFANTMKQCEPVESTRCVSHAFDEGTLQTCEIRRILGFFSRLFPEDGGRSACTHGKHFLLSELSLLAVIPNYPVSLLSRALHSGIWLMPSQSLVWSALPSGMWARLSEMFPEPARSWFPPGWLTDTARPAIRTDDQFPLLHAHLRFITGSPLAPRRCRGRKRHPGCRQRKDGTGKTKCMAPARSSTSLSQTT